MIAFNPNSKPNPKPTSPAPNFAPEPGGSQMEGFFRNVQFILGLQGFDLGKSGNEYVLKRGKEVMIMAPDMHDMLMLLCVTGAWANVKKEDK
jgi:hypothetical protein